MLGRCFRITQRCVRLPAARWSSSTETSGGIAVDALGAMPKTADGARELYDTWAATYEVLLFVLCARMDTTNAVGLKGVWVPCRQHIYSDVCLLCIPPPPSCSHHTGIVAVVGVPGTIRIFEPSCEDGSRHGCTRGASNSSLAL